MLLNVGDDELVHAVLVLGHRGGDLVIYEPAAGTVTSATARDFRGGAMTGATNWRRVFGVILPISG